MKIKMFTPCEYDDDYSLIKINLVNEAPSDSDYWGCTLYQGEHHFLYFKRNKVLFWTVWYAWVNSSWVKIDSKNLKHPFLRGRLQSIISLIESIDSTRAHYKGLEIGDERRGHGDWRAWRDIHRESVFWKEAA